MSKQQKRRTSIKATSMHLNTNKNASMRPRASATNAQKCHKNTKKPPERGTKAFKTLQKQWYERLKAAGFKDLERPMPDGSTDSWLHGQSMRDLARQYSPETQLYYERLRAYLTHRPHWHEDAFYRFAARLHADGVSYREICERARAKGLKPNANKWHVFKAVEALRPLAERWNKTSAKGCDFKADVGDE